MRALILICLALLCLVVAMLSLPLPLPLGTVFFFLAVSLILMTSLTLQRWFFRQRLRYRVLDRLLRSVEDYVPRMLRQALNGGRPPRE